MFENNLQVQIVYRSNEILAARLAAQTRRPLSYMPFWFPTNLSPLGIISSSLPESGAPSRGDTVLSYGPHESSF